MNMSNNPGNSCVALLLRWSSFFQNDPMMPLLLPESGECG
jgi:hypothetical protein